jgi:hypothetical protein
MGINIDDQQLCASSIYNSNYDWQNISRKQYNISIWPQFHQQKFVCVGLHTCIHVPVQSTLLACAAGTKSTSKSSIHKWKCEREKHINKKRFSYKQPFYLFAKINIPYNFHSQFSFFASVYIPLSLGRATNCRCVLQVHSLKAQPFCGWLIAIFCAGWWLKAWNGKKEGK